MRAALACALATMCLTGCDSAEEEPTAPAPKAPAAVVRAKEPEPEPEPTLETPEEPEDEFALDPIDHDPAPWRGRPPRLPADAPVADPSGPIIRVLAPARGATLPLDKAGVAVKYEIIDTASALAKARVAGVELAPRGRDRARGVVTVRPRTGLNVIVITAEDEHGNRSHHAQSFYAAPAYRPVDGPLRGDAGVDGGLQMWIGQGAIDSGAPRDRARPRDLASALELVLASLDLDALVQRTITVEQGGFDGSVEIAEFKRGEYPEVGLAVDRGELELRAKLRDVAVQLRLAGTWLKVKINIPATVSAKSMGVTARIGLSVQGQGGARVELHDLKVSFPELRATIDRRWGLPVNWIISVFRGAITRELERQLERRLAPMVAFPLTYALNRTAINRTIRLPLRAAFGDWTRDAVIEMRSELSALTLVPAARRREGGIEVGSRSSLTSRRVIQHANAGALVRGACREPGRGRAPRSERGAVEVRVQLDLINQFLASLWSAGVFQTSRDLSATARTFDPSVERLTITLDPRLPPLLLDCRQAGALDLEVGELRVHAELVSGGVTTALEADVAVAAAVFAKPSRAGGIELELERAHLFEFDVARVLVDGVATPASDVDATEIIRAGSEDALDVFSGMIAELPIPDLELSSIVERVPDGRIDPTIERAYVDDGAVVIRGRVH